MTDAVNVENIAAEILFNGVAPERKEDLQRLWAEHGFHFARVGDTGAFKMEAGPFGIVEFTSQTTAQIWLLGYAAWCAIEAYGGLCWSLRAKGQSFDLSKMDLLPSETSAQEKLEALPLEARAFGQSDQTSNFAWPERVPVPGQTAFANKREKAAYDLICFAAAYVFLHEMKHVMFRHPSEPRLSDHKEEMACDLFAREFLLGHAAEYARDFGWNCDDVLRKRAIGILVANFVFLAVTPMGLWWGSEKHPPLAKRLRQIIEVYICPETTISGSYHQAC